MENELTVAAIVVTYNRCELLAECIDALTAQTYSNLKFILLIMQVPMEQKNL